MGLLYGLREHKKTAEKAVKISYFSSPAYFSLDFWLGFVKFRCVERAVSGLQVLSYMFKESQMLSP